MSNAAPTSVLLQELQNLKSQESALIQVLSRCNTFLNKLKVEELQLKAMLREERAAASANDPTVDMNQMNSGKVEKTEAANISTPLVQMVENGTMSSGRDEGQPADNFFTADGFQLSDFSPFPS